MAATICDLKVVQTLTGPISTAALERQGLISNATNHPATVVELQNKDGEVLRTVARHPSRAKPTPASPEAPGWTG